MDVKQNSSIPTVDFMACSLDIADEDLRISDLQKVGEDMCEAFHEVGFVHLKNFGIGQDKVDKALSLLKEFIDLPRSVKAEYETKPGFTHGWVALEGERLSNSRPNDYKETFNYLQSFPLAQNFSKLSEDVPEFGDTLMTMFAVCTRLTKRILDSLGYGLQLKDPGFFSGAHNPYTRKNGTALRLLYYPPVNQNTALKPGQIRCGEHSDYGSITLLFQDNAGGLEVLSHGKFIEATPIAGTVLVNIGDLMQRWTGDYFTSTVHRVVIPSKESAVKERTSMAFFVNPDDDCEIVTLKGNQADSSKPAIKTREYLDMKIKAAFNTSA